MKLNTQIILLVIVILSAGYSKEDDLNDET